MKNVHIKITGAYGSGKTACAVLLKKALNYHLPGTSVIIVEEGVPHNPDADVIIECVTPPDNLVTYPDINQ